MADLLGGLDEDAFSSHLSSVKQLSQRSQKPSSQRAAEVSAQPLKSQRLVNVVSPRKASGSTASLKSKDSKSDLSALSDSQSLARADRESAKGSQQELRLSQNSTKEAPGPSQGASKPTRDGNARAQKLEDDVHSLLQGLDEDAFKPASSSWSEPTSAKETVATSRPQHKPSAPSSQTRTRPMSAFLPSSSPAGPSTIATKAIVRSQSAQLTSSNHDKLLPARSEAVIPSKRPASPQLTKERSVGKAPSAPSRAYSEPNKKPFNSVHTSAVGDKGKTRFREADASRVVPQSPRAQPQKPKAYKGWALNDTSEDVGHIDIVPFISTTDTEVQFMFSGSRVPHSIAYQSSRLYPRDCSTCPRLPTLFAERVRSRGEAAGRRDRADQSKFSTSARDWGCFWIDIASCWECERITSWYAVRRQVVGERRGDTRKG